jgi:hypothetical protein
MTQDKKTHSVRRQVIADTGYGLYLWEMPDGRVIADQDGNYLNIPGRPMDVFRMNQLAKYVREALGITEGKAVFYANRRRVSQGEWEDQMERTLDGKMGDPIDPGNQKARENRREAGF